MWDQKIKLFEVSKVLRGLRGTYRLDTFESFVKASVLEQKASTMAPDSHSNDQVRTALIPAGLTSWTVQTFRSLRSYNYRIYASAQLFSNCGSWVQLTAISWLVFELTDSAFLLGLVSFLRQSPVLLLGVVGGWMADHIDRKSILLCTKVLMLTQACLLGVLTMSENVNIVYILILATGLGVANALDMPAKQAFTYNLVDRKDIVNAVSLNTSIFHVSRTLGPVVAISIVGVLGARRGEAACFFLNALSYIGVIYALARIRPENTTSKPDRKSGPGLEDAVRFMLETGEVRKALLLGATSSLLCMQYIVMLPIFAKSVLGRSIDGFGFLMASAAVGSFFAALALANRGKSREQLSTMVSFAAVAFATTLVLFSTSANFYLSCLLAVALGFCSTTQLSGSNSLLQLMVDDSLRGRILSLWMIAISGLGPLGGLLVGWAASIYGAPVTLTTCGLIAGMISLFFVLRK